MKNRNNYYILTLSFSGINTDTKENLISGFRNNLLERLKIFRNKYKIDLDNEVLPPEIIEKFLSEITNKIDIKLYILIDVDNHFANELISFERKMFKEVV